jgi:hypothetical protein
MLISTMAAVGTVLSLINPPGPGPFSLLPKPLYPLYAMVTGAVDFTDADVELIGSNFNYCHCTTTPEQTAAFKRVNPAFRSVKYNNPSGTGTSPGEYASMEAFERDHRMGSGGGWYVGGRLREAAGAGATELVLVPDSGRKIGTFPRIPTEVMFVASTAGSGDYSGYNTTAESDFEWVTYARLGDELVKIVSVEKLAGADPNASAATNATKLTVVRAFGGTKQPASSYAAGTAVLGPLYNRLPFDSSDGSGTFVSYGLMASTTLASDFLYNFTAQALIDGYDGSWYDNFGTSIFTVSTAAGLKLGVQDYYDPEHERYWNISTYLQVQKGRLDRAFDAVMAHGRPAGDKVRPTILANGFFRGFGPFDVSEGFTMMQNGSERTPDTPTAADGPFRLDGYCVEDFYMSESGSCGYESIRSYHTPKQWLQAVQAVAAAARVNAAVFPTIAGAGCGSQSMEANPNRTRDEGAAYVSFLFAVEKTAAGGGRPSLGIQPLYFRDPTNQTSARYAKLHPRFLWDIGAPAETKAEVADYILPSAHTSHNATYARRFEHGLVLINPDLELTDRIDLGAAYPGLALTDPSQGGCGGDRSAGAGPAKRAHSPGTAAAAVSIAAAQQPPPPVATTRVAAVRPKSLLMRVLYIKATADRGVRLCLIYEAHARLSQAHFQQRRGDDTPSASGGPRRGLRREQPSRG